MYKIVRYNPEYKRVWDDLITIAKNSIFQFYRDFMEYHSDKFEECSFLFYKNQKVVAVIPGNIDQKIFYSHQYLTFGGLVTTSAIRLKSVLKIFELLNQELGRLGIKEVVYKSAPYIYHDLPAQEDLYALYLNHAEKIGCNISSTIYQTERLKFDNSRKNGLRKSIKSGIEIMESDNYSSFWDILKLNLEKKYNTKPVHSLNEILYLKSKFPDNIRLFLATYFGETLAGVVIFQTKNVVHVQYITASTKGKEMGALDLMFSELLSNVFSSNPIFDFGKSSEKMGELLNEKLIFQKEGFGARGVVYEVYKYKLND